MLLSVTPHRPCNDPRSEWICRIGDIYESGKAPEHDGFGRYVTIDELFNTIQEAIDGKASQIIVTYDPEVGYPTEASIDYDARIADEEYGFIVLATSKSGTL